MPDDGTLQGTTAPAQQASGRAGRTQVVGFVTDTETEAALRQGLHDVAQSDIVIYRGDSRRAITAMTKLPSPYVLVVDISGDEQPMSALAALSEVVEPDVQVLVIGDHQGMDLYRQLTRALGVGEYLYKPLNADVVAQHFGPFVTRASSSASQSHGGRIIAMTGVCGGAGATTLAANLSWYLATEAKRHTVLLDANLHTGTAALLLGAKAGGGLRLALETPARVDELFMARIAHPSGERLAVIAGEEALSEHVTVSEGAADRLLQALRRQYNYVVADVPLAPLLWYRQLLDQARQRVLVMEPTLPAVRDTLRLLALPIGARQVRHPIVVLNKLDAPGSMTRRQIETALKQEVATVVPFLPKVINQAATLGVPAVASRGAFRTAIIDLAREVATIGPVSVKGGRLSGLFGRRARR